MALALCGLSRLLCLAVLALALAAPIAQAQNSQGDNQGGNSQGGGGHSAPGPLVGTGIDALVLLAGVGYVAWRRSRRKSD